LVKRTKLLVNNLQSKGEKKESSPSLIGRIFPILALSIFSSMLGVGLIAPILPLYAESMGATGIGVIFASFSISRTVFIPIIGRLSDRWGRKVFICPGILAYALISIGYVWAAQVPELTLIRLLHGAAAGMIIPIAQAYIGDLAPNGQEGTWMGYFNAAFFMGFGFGPLMGGILSDSLGINASFYGMGILNLLAFFFALCFLPEIRHRRNEIVGRRAPPEGMRKSGAVKGLFGYRLAYALGRGSFTCFLPILASAYLGLTFSQIGLLIAVNIMLMSLLQTRFGKIADRHDRRALVVCGSLINAAFLLLIPLCGTFWQLLILCTTGALGGSISMPAASAITVDEGRKYGMGSTIGMFTMAMSIGMCAGPILGGGIADALGVSSVFYFGGIMGILGAGVFAWFTR
jgi:MFS family permease